jgi:pyruvate ferredoxin oxidoreductase alpha subunit
MAVAQPVGVYEREDLLTGCQAVAEGIRLANVDVIAAYPIRPYTEVMDAISKIIADGKLDAEYIVADSEHSQFEIVKHAASVGARAFAGSSGTGWMYGFEALVVTATDRLPVLFLVGNRALDDPGAFGVEHNDALAIRDMGWLLCWVATAQEALEHVLLGYRIAEDKRVMMPMALAMDGAFLTHSQHIVRIPSQEAVNRFLPPFDLADRRLHPDNPVSIAPQVNEDWVMEIRRRTGRPPAAPGESSPPPTRSSTRCSGPGTSRPTTSRSSRRRTRRWCWWAWEPWPCPPAPRYGACGSRATGWAT